MAAHFKEWHGMSNGVAINVTIASTNLTGRVIEPREAHQSACTL